MVHEAMHALFYSSSLFLNYFPEYNGKKYKFLDDDGYWKIQGPAILEQIRTHFNCPTATGGIYI